jgi:peroxiredoxin
MSRLSVGDVAPDFALPNHEATLVSLSDVLKQHNALLLFNLGFI